MVIMALSLFEWRGMVPGHIGHMMDEEEQVVVNSVLNLLIVGRTMLIWIKLADCCGRSKKNTALVFLGEI
ncbi:hypothetical protein BvCmsSINP017_02137 [Escherichia coli]|nr:hypothetical protein BvCmsKKNP020_03045 [Escherichia coli]GDM94467.1 hypothetical protein BvCmsNSNP032_02752 [Escherichia coli]GDS66974.1 hypothetical protein BvCmsSINP013_04110 [Escherichia coli]GDT58691.1 hypothetical protein BvCmsSINP017_02137 [Escherichia coli]